MADKTAHVCVKNSLLNAETGLSLRSGRPFSHWDSYH